MFIFDIEKIKQLRESKGFNHNEFAGRIDTSRQLVHMWESGVSQPTIKSLLKICNTFKIKPSTFFTTKKEN